MDHSGSWLEAEFIWDGSDDRSQGVTAVWQGEGNEAGVERLPGTSAAVKLSFS